MKASSRKRPNQPGKQPSEQQGPLQLPLELPGSPSKPALMCFPKHNMCGTRNPWLFISASSFDSISFTKTSQTLARICLRSPKQSKKTSQNSNNHQKPLGLSSTEPTSAKSAWRSRQILRKSYSHGLSAPTAPLLRNTPDSQKVAFKKRDGVWPNKTNSCAHGLKIFWGI